MPSLSASQLPPETLHPGDTIAYYSMMFGFGDKRGYREAVVNSIDARPGVEFPIEITTQEIIQRTMMIKRLYSSDGEPVVGLWRKLRSFTLVGGKFDAPSARTEFAQAVSSIVSAAFSGTYRAVQEQDSPPVRYLDLSAPREEETPSLASPSRDSGSASDADSLDALFELEEYEEKAPVPISSARGTILSISQSAPRGLRPSASPKHPKTPGRRPNAAAKSRQGATSEGSGAESSRKRTAEPKRAPHKSRSSAFDTREEAVARPPKVPLREGNGGGSEGLRKQSAFHSGEESDSLGPEIEIVSDGGGNSWVAGLDTLALAATNDLPAFSKPARASETGTKDPGQHGRDQRGDGAPMASEESPEVDESDVREEDTQDGSNNVDVGALEEYLSKIPTRTERNKIRHQPKKRIVGWHQPRSRKKRYQKKAAIVRSGMRIHNAHTVKAIKMQDLLKAPGMREKMNSVRFYQPFYVEPKPTPPGKVTQVHDDVT